MKSHHSIALSLIAFGLIFLSSPVLAHDGEHPSDGASMKGQMGHFEEGSGSAAIDEYSRKEHAAKEYMEEGSGGMKEMGMPASAIPAMPEGHDAKGMMDHQYEKGMHQGKEYMEEGSGGMRGMPTN